MATPRAEIVVDDAAIRHNVRVLGDLVAPAALMMVVKADGYGHGLLESARAGRAAGAAWLGVATIDEALALRAGGDTGRILCWLTVPGEAYAEPLRAEIDVTASSVAGLDEIAAACVSTGRAARVQLEVDTGLSRGGAPAEQWSGVLERARAGERAGHWRITGIWSHLSSSDEPDDPANAAQERRFGEALDLAHTAGLRPEVRHLANSAAAILRPGARHDAVRCGIAAYGLDPAPGRTPELGLRPAMTVRATLATTRRLDAGSAVSYGRTWTAEHDTTVGLVPMGYADGVPRIAGNRAQVWVGGRRRPVRGRVCMDQFVVDLDGDDPGAGASVVLFGPGDQGEPTAQDWAQACDTISYEIVTRVGSLREPGHGGRVVRRHVDSASPALAQAHR